MWKKKMKHKKLQMFLVGLVLFATTALFTMCVAFTLELSGFTERGINEENCPDTYVFDTGTDKLLENINDKKLTDNVESVRSLIGRTISVPIMHEGNDISLYYDSMLDASKYKEFKYIHPEETNQKLPEQGEVWLAKTVADPDNIKVGDSISLEYDKKMTLKVVGLFTSTSSPKSMPTTPILGNIEDINKLQDSEPAALHAVILKKFLESDCDKIGDRDPYMRLCLSRNDARVSMTDVSGMMGGFGSTAGIIVFVVALVIIRFIIKTNLIKEFKSIGIYKSLGYTSSKIRSFYLKGYMFVGLISITLGAVSSLALVYPLGMICTKYVAGFSISSVSAIVCAAVIAVLMLMLYINLRMALKKVRTITPVEAIAVGVTSAEKKIKHSIIRSAKSSAAMAINEMFKYKRSTIMMLLVLTVSMYLSMIFLMCYTSSSDMADKGNLWFAMPDKDVYISGAITDEVRDYVDENKYVKSSVYSECIYSPKSIRIDGKGGGDADIDVKEVGFVTFSVFDKTDPDITKINMMKGYAPKHTGEVSIGKSLSSLLDKGTGEYINININGHKDDFLVTGVYQSMMNNGYGIMMLEEDMKVCDPEYVTTRGYICLNDTNDYKAFKDDIEGKFAGISADNHWKAIENSVSSIETMLVAVSLILVSVFIIFSILNTVIVIQMDNSNWRRRYGIMKSLGFTTGYIVRQTLWKYLMLSGISIAIATAIHKAFSRKFIAVMVIDAFSDDAVKLTMLITGFVVLIMGIAWLLSRSVKKISPIELMEE